VVALVVGEAEIVGKLLIDGAAVGAAVSSAMITLLVTMTNNVTDIMLLRNVFMVRLLG